MKTWMCSLSESSILVSVAAGSTYEKGVQLYILFKISNQSSFQNIVYIPPLLPLPPALLIRDFFVCCWDFSSDIFHVNLVILEGKNGPHSKSKALFGTLL